MGHVLSQWFYNPGSVAILMVPLIGLGAFLGNIIGDRHRLKLGAALIVGTYLFIPIAGTPYINTDKGLLYGEPCCEQFYDFSSAIERPKLLDQEGTPSEAEFWLGGLIRVLSLIFAFNLGFVMGFRERTNTLLKQEKGSSDESLIIEIMESRPGSFPLSPISPFNLATHGLLSISGFATLVLMNMVG